ncbi:hypothetical protein DIE19_05140 [Burkholderia sp. Bp9126]|nr:hypothetical protein DIE19_05140 [Burkholderia sp. Bp9126]
MAATTLHIDIDSAGLNTIYGAQLVVTLVRGVDVYVASQALASSTGATVIWQAFAPLASNRVVIDGGYRLFMTTTPLQPTCVLTLNATSPDDVQIAKVYAFQNGHIDASPIGDGPDGAYSIANLAIGTTCSLGLAQQATVNDAPSVSPQTAVPVLWNTQAAFYVQDHVALFLSSGQNGMVIPSMPNDPLDVPLTPGDVKIVFDDATNRFVLA